MFQQWLKSNSFIFYFKKASVKIPFINKVILAYELWRSIKTVLYNLYDDVFAVNVNKVKVFLLRNFVKGLILRLVCFILVRGPKFLN